MIATKIGFFAFQVHFDTLKLRFFHFLFFLFYTKILKTALEAVGDENRHKFSKANFNPLKLTFL
jgi:hypothetical protein